MRSLVVRAHPAACPHHSFCFLSPVCFTRRYAAHDYFKHNLLGALVNNFLTPTPQNHYIGWQPVGQLPPSRAAV
jgi:hypothetical protein